MHLTMLIAHPYPGPNQVVLKKLLFFRVFISFVPCFLLCHGQNIHRKDILKKKMNPVCFLLRQESPIQKSATPQGLPPPTQQIKIQMQTSWVGLSTSDDNDRDKDLQKDKYKDKDTQTKTNTKCFQDPMYAIFSKAGGPRI